MTETEWNESVKTYVSTYGPLAFGVITLLVLWFAILAPQLDRQTLDFAAQRQVLEALQRNREDQLLVTKQLRETAEILDQITARMSTR